MPPLAFPLTVADVAAVAAAAADALARTRAAGDGLGPDPVPCEDLVRYRRARPDCSPADLHAVRLGWLAARGRTDHFLYRRYEELPAGRRLADAVVCGVVDALVRPAGPVGSSSEVLPYPQPSAPPLPLPETVP